MNLLAKIKSITAECVKNFTSVPVHLLSYFPKVNVHTIISYNFPRNIVSTPKRMAM